MSDSIDSILCAAIEISSPDERMAYLDQACGGDLQLRSDVEKLLAAHFHAGRFLDEPIGGHRPAEFLDGMLAPDDRCGSPGGREVVTPSRAGRYHVLDEVARGGMGAVLRAYDPELDRTLAVKIMLRHEPPGSYAENRFLEEARITGQLQHPGIPPVHERGRLDDGRLFFAMRLIDGRTLKELLGEREEPGADLPRLLGVFEQVCQTMAYAHSRGVMHRDLKPANIMVGAFGEVQVMDWGLAKSVSLTPTVEHAPDAEPPAHSSRARDDVVQPFDLFATDGTHETGPPAKTTAGAVLGTPAYMAPEQARGEVEHLDERVDVFGLGALLCEILTGQPPYVGQSVSEVIACAREGRLQDCFRRLNACGAERELINLTLHCLARERDSRPRHGGMVAESVTNYLVGVQQRLEAAELARVEAQTRAEEERRRAKLRMSLATAVLVILALVGGGWSYLQHLAIVEARKTAAAEREELMERARCSQEISDALVEAERYRARSASGSPSEILTSLEKALAATRRADAIADSGHVSAELQERLKVMMSQLREEHRDQKLLADLDEAYRAQTATDVKDNRYALERAIPLFHKAFADYGLTVGQGTVSGIAAMVSGRPVSVRTAIVDACDEWLRLPGSDGRFFETRHRDWLLQVVTALDAAHPSPASHWRRSLRMVLFDSPLPHESGAVLLQLSDDPAVQLQSTRTLVAFCRMLHSRGARKEAIGILRRRHLADPGDFSINENLGFLLDHPWQRIRFATAAVAVRPGSAGVHLNLGHLLADAGELNEAIDIYREAIRIDPEYAAAHAALGAALAECGHGEEALNAYRKAIQISPGDAVIHFNLGILLQNNGQHDQALAAFRQAIQIEPDFREAHDALGSALFNRGQMEEAVNEFRAAIQSSPPRTPSGRTAPSPVAEPSPAQRRTNLGNALLCLGQWDEAIREFREAIRQDPQFAEAHCNLGQLLSRTGDFQEALHELRIGHALGAERADWRYPSAQWVAEAERFARLDATLPEVLAGRMTLSDPAEKASYAELCHRKRLFVHAATFYADAMADPVADDRAVRAIRYRAACAAAMAGDDAGNDGAPTDGVEPPRWRRQAIAWLRADLADCDSQLQTATGQARGIIVSTLRRWQLEPELAGLREPDHIATLPADEQQMLQSFWAELDALLKRAEHPPG
jgi:eukaryotic-like serine/threonine-protein kinase